MSYVDYRYNSVAACLLQQRDGDKEVNMERVRCRATQRRRDGEREYEVFPGLVGWRIKDLL